MHPGTRRRAPYLRAQNDLRGRNFGPIAASFATVGLLAASLLTASVLTAGPVAATPSVPEPMPIPAESQTADAVSATDVPAPIDDGDAELLTALNEALASDATAASSGTDDAQAAAEAQAEEAQAAREQREARLRSAVVELAKEQVGDRYSAGSTGPNAFDCSGLVRFVFSKVLGTYLPHYSRAQYSRVDRIPLKVIKPGDLVFYLSGGAHHVGIYIGAGRMVHAANPGAGVKISPISGSWYSRTFTGAGRIIKDA